MIWYEFFLLAYNWGIYAVAMLVAIVVPALLTLLVYKRQQAAGKLDLATA